MTYSTPVTTKFSEKSLSEIEKASQSLGIGRSTLLREIVIRYLPHYLASAGDRRLTYQKTQKKLG